MMQTSGRLLPQSRRFMLIVRHLVSSIIRLIILPRLLCSTAVTRHWIWCYRISVSQNLCQMLLVSTVCQRILTAFILLQEKATRWMRCIFITRVAMVSMDDDMGNILKGLLDDDMGNILKGLLDDDMGNI
eukprot:RCo049838